MPSANSQNSPKTTPLKTPDFQWFVVGDKEGEGGRRGERPMTLVTKVTAKFEELAIAAAAAAAAVVVVVVVVV
ncbi:hypothetical protein ElyMa_006016500 [Elysia marginata]|uniref:Uncharacterized protein n=1 Tax=Elysia marginata TaxID=1093978 RepID=A0AAV4GJ35_9GAST|nr:hypothetical protein ElyMa_006016500 [Elysia marginata]